MRFQWMTALFENQITGQQIARGLSRARVHQSPWLPSVGQFIGWCLEEPGVEELPSEIQARLAMIREMCKPKHLRQWESLHPAVYWVFSQQSASVWSGLNNKQMESEFAKLWAVVVSMVKKGHSFDPAPTALPQQSVVPEPPASKETAQEHLSRIRSLITGD